ncbi:excalibur calcium-binding domain-containing protein [Nocardioides daejeonensis]|uniref:excalibur calcium-binding domain-containing protein n=1 Tax=Nocardioides daejeonensis TaxID=1046556 RepID=UPI001EF5684C|nr:excalibur calcium-binding domain-containing protein [Nocardioides daejeonensis]
MSTPPPGWYRIPGTNEEGYWDGHVWTPDRRAAAPMPGFAAPLPAAQRPRSHSPVMAWIRRHKVVTGLVAVLTVGSCGALLDSAEDAPARGVVAPETRAPAEAPAPAPAETPEPEPTPEEVWRAALESDEKAIIGSLATTLGARRSVVREHVADVVGACGLAAQGKPLKVRTARFARALGGAAAGATQDQTIAAVEVVLTGLCPETTELHAEQVEARRVAIRQAQERARKPRLREERARAREQARLEREREARLQEERQAALHVYFENCTAARAAGAAPVRRGDPGYGSHLDRDGDGIGCE